MKSPSLWQFIRALLDDPSLARRWATSRGTPLSVAPLHALMHNRGLLYEQAAFYRWLALLTILAVGIYAASIMGPPLVAGVPALTWTLTLGILGAVFWSIALPPWIYLLGVALVVPSSLLRSAAKVASFRTLESLKPAIGPDVGWVVLLSALATAYFIPSGLVTGYMARCIGQIAGVRARTVIRIVVAYAALGFGDVLLGNPLVGLPRFLGMAVGIWLGFRLRGMPYQGADAIDTSLPNGASTPSREHRSARRSPAALELAQQPIEAIHEMLRRAIEADIVDMERRRLLFHGISKSILAAIPAGSSPVGQYRHDLFYLLNVDDGSPDPPLDRWARNADEISTKMPDSPTFRSLAKLARGGG